MTDGPIPGSQQGLANPGKYAARNTGCACAKGSSDEADGGGSGTGAVGSPLGSSSKLVTTWLPFHDCGNSMIFRFLESVAMARSLHRHGDRKCMRERPASGPVDGNHPADTEVNANAGRADCRNG